MTLLYSIDELRLSSRNFIRGVFKFRAGRTSINPRRQCICTCINLDFEQSLREEFDM